MGSTDTKLSPYLNTATRGGAERGKDLDERSGSSPTVRSSGGTESYAGCRERVKARVAETTLLMETLEKQKHKLEAQLKSDHGSAVESSRDDAPSLESMGLPSSFSTDAMNMQVAEITEGMSDALRRQVETAIADLGLMDQQLQEEHIPLEPAGAHAQETKQTRNSGGGRVYTPSRRELQLEQQVKQLKQKMEMSKSIMRKLHLSNVELEKELKIMVATGQPSTFAASKEHENSRACRSDESVGSATADGTFPQTSTAGMLQERERTIQQLSAALDSSRCRAAALERSLLQKEASSSGSSNRTRVSNAVTDVLAQSAVHFQQYQQIRTNYNKLLTRRTQALSRASGVSREAKNVVNELQARLSKEMEEREVESAMYNARLYENEKQQGDWYVERRMLEKRIKELHEELKERDKMDVEIEKCVCDLFNQISALERDNTQLREQLLGSKELPD